MFPYYTISPLQGGQNAVKSAIAAYNIVYYPSTGINDEEVERILRADIITYSAATTSTEAIDRTDL